MPNIMKRTFTVTLFSFLAVLLAPISAFAETGALYEKYSRAGEVKVYVALPKEVGVTGKVDPSSLKLELEKALTERKSIHFEIIENPQEADLTVETDLQGFYFSETDPVDMLIGVGMAAMDAAKQDHFARLEADFRVVDNKSGQTIWKDRLIGSLTDEKMTEAESKVKILTRAADIFVRSAFGRAKRSR